jgi:hypothetical protein
MARENSTREQLNSTARARLLADGLLADIGVRIGGRDWAVGDRVIARRNDRRIDIDNSTTATITSLSADGASVVVRTDTGQERVLDRAYVSDHLEHAYAITGHSSQGATVDAAIVVGRPEEFTKEWAYTVLSRARTDTSLHLIADHGPDAAERSGYAPRRWPVNPPTRSTHSPAQCDTAKASVSRPNTPDPTRSHPRPPSAPTHTPRNARRASRGLRATCPKRDTSRGPVTMPASAADDPGSSDASNGR